MKSTLFLLLLLLALAVTGCAGFSTLEQDVAALKHQVASLQAQVAEIEGSRNPLRKSLATLNLRMDETLTELQQVRGAVDESQYLLQQELANINQRLSLLETGSSAYTPAPEPSSPAPPTAPPKPAQTLDPEEIYAQAYNVYKEGRLTEARDAFTGFLRQFPDTEYSDNAQFWIGECHFKENNFEQAILAYEDVVSKYPAGNKVPDALLKQGLCFQKLGDMVSSRIILQRVVENHPDSPQAEIAKSRLEKSN